MSRSPPITLLLAGDVTTGGGAAALSPRGPVSASRRPTVADALALSAAAARAETAPGLLEALAMAAPGPAEPSPAQRWGPALDLIEAAAPQVRILSLESSVTAAGAPWPAKGVQPRSDPAQLAALLAARPDVCVLANNHVLDWGRDGLRDTLQALGRAGLAHAGAGADGTEAWAPARVRLSTGGDLLVFACATASSGVPPGWAAAPGRSGIALLPDLSEATARQLAEDIAERRGPRDRVVVSVHWGGTAGSQVPAAHRRFAHQLIDRGAADLIHGHSSHLPLPVEVYRGKLILYGCGDLMREEADTLADERPGASSRSAERGSGSQGRPGGDGPLRRDMACLYFATLSGGSGRLLGLDIVPLQRRDQRLTLPDETARDWVRRRFEPEALDAWPPPSAADAPPAPTCRLVDRPGGGWSLRWEGRPGGG